VELPADSLGVGESANVVWLLQAREDGLWDFADGRASYLNVIESEHRAKNISNTPAWLDTLWLTPDLRERTKRHLAPTYREELLRLGDKPATSNGVPLSLLWALLDANFEKSSR
jgi:hypothetical protein